MSQVSKYALKVRRNYLPTPFAFFDTITQKNNFTCRGEVIFPELSFFLIF